LKENAFEYIINGNVIDFYLNFETNESYQLFHNSSIYFKDYGFNLVQISKNEWLLKRGSIFLNPYLINPLKCKSEIKIFINKSKVDLHVTLNTGGMFFLKNDIDLWKTFLLNYVKFLNIKFDYKNQFKITKRFHLKNTLKLGVYIILLFLALLIPFGYLAYITNQFWILYIVSPLSFGIFGYFYKLKDKE
jgi:hypothetical protein